MTARKVLRSDHATPAVAYLRHVLADPKATRTQKLFAARSLLQFEKHMALRDALSPRAQAKAKAQAQEPTGTAWDQLLAPHARSRTSGGAPPHDGPPGQ